jgi:hypothetical protein
MKLIVRGEHVVKDGAVEFVPADDRFVMPAPLVHPLHRYPRFFAALIVVSCIGGLVFGWWLSSRG